MDTEQRLAAIEARIKALEDSAAVGGYTQARHERYMADHASWLINHDEAILAHKQWLIDHDKAVTEGKERDTELDKRIANMVSAIGELIARIDSKQ